MAAAFLPWEKWIGRLLHVLAIAVRRLIYRMQRRRSLARSSGWPETEGTVQSVQWDSSLPREEIAYSFVTDRGSQAGYHWLWFDSPSERQPKVGDKITVRYDENAPDKSVFIRVV
jgi:hypothetical protein